MADEMDEQGCTGHAKQVALRRTDADELLGLMAHAVDDTILAVEIIYIESADHSNANILHEFSGEKKYIGIVKQLLSGVRVGWIKNVFPVYLAG